MDYHQVQPGIHRIMPPSKTHQVFIGNYCVTMLHTWIRPRYEHDMAREPLPAMVRTRPLDPSKSVINFSKSSKTIRPVDSPATASLSRESDEVRRLSLGHLVINYIHWRYFASKQNVMRNVSQNSNTPQIEEPFDQPLLKKLKVNFVFNITPKENFAGQAELSPWKSWEPWAPEWYNTSGYPTLNHPSANINATSPRSICFSQNFCQAGPPMNLSWASSC